MTQRRISSNPGRSVSNEPCEAEYRDIPHCDTHIPHCGIGSCWQVPSGLPAGLAIKSAESVQRKPQEFDITDYKKWVTRTFPCKITVCFQLAGAKVKVPEETWLRSMKVRVALPALLGVCVSLAAMVACGGGSASAPPPVQRPLAGEISATSNPLVAKYSISPPAEASVAVEFGPDLSYGFQTLAQAASAGNPVNILVAGMKPGTPYHMRAIVTYLDGSQQFDSDHSFTTGAVDAARIPSMKVSTTNGATPAPGVELISLTQGTGSQLEALATDPAGNVVWYYDYDPALGTPQPIKLLPNGHMMMVLCPAGASGGTLLEVDLAGNILRQFDYNALAQKLTAAGYNIQVYSIDHDFLWFPNGHVLLIVTDSRVFTDLPGYPGQTTVLGDAIVELDANNNPVWVWDAFDHLDVNRHPIFFPDWIHANALAYSSDDGNLLVSLRHQSWILKLDYENGSGSGDIIWKLGYQGDFELNSDSPADWFYAQHDANIASSNTTGDFQLAMFDNGDFRLLDNNGDFCLGLYPPYCYSAPAIFEVNETARTASRQWSYVTSYSYWGGVTRVLPNSNIYIDETAPADLNESGSRVLEVTQAPNPAIVWQMEIDNQNSYRTIHLPSLYPNVQW